MSVQTFLMYSMHSSLLPVFPSSRQPGAFSRSFGQIEYCSSSFTTTAYAKANRAPHGRLTEVAGALAVAAAEPAHAVLAARGEWVTNEKLLLQRAGLRQIDTVIGGVPARPEALIRGVSEAERLFDF